MSITRWFQPLTGLVGRGSRKSGGRPADTDLFSGPRAEMPAPLAGSAGRKKLGWFQRLLSLRWLPLGNRRKRSSLVQSEMLLQETRPLRHDLGEDDVELVRRRRSKVIYESQPVPTVPKQLDTENAYARLRNRAPVSERIVSN